MRVMIYFRSIILMLHNAFDKKIPHLRTITLNSNYYLITRSPQSLNSIKNLFIQAFPGESNVVMDIYRHINDEKTYSHMLIDNHCETPSKFRIRANLFSDDEPMEVFILNKKR